jgi:adenosylcobinamide kinase/adenosylcobinamide-phosphate guanylyltransferase
LGGARSGKSAHAEALVAVSGLVPIYLATAEALDDEMRLRIDHHRARRDSTWLTVEEPLELPGALGREAGPGRAVLIDCLTLWLSNLLLAGRDVEAAGNALMAVLEQRRGSVVLVSNEVGFGIVPTGALSRSFVDHAGRLHQRVAAAADHVRLIVAGLPMDLKSPCIS